jgi:hypothetical protein
LQCIACEQDNPAGSKYCSLCGLPLPLQGLNAPASDVICPSCQSLNPAGSFFCYNCGDYFFICEEKPSGNGLKQAEPALQPAAIKARIIIPGRPDIALNGSPAFIERSSFDPTLPHDVLMSISRQHVMISYDNGTYYVQDHGRDGTGSTNHTKLNGTDIYRKGRQPLKDSDRIELAHQSELALTFKTS